MFYFCLVAFAVLPLSTALQLGGVGPREECPKPHFPREKHVEFVKKTNHYRKLMVEGKQRNGPANYNLPTGENVSEMNGVHKDFSEFLQCIPSHFYIQVWSCDLEEEAFIALNNRCQDPTPSLPYGTTRFY
ncbi:hypothetical protein Y032_0489g2371 [Ancylostoma ceylanicum]|nr:hypothetical protein Y032_0489g2371 [Ancylostoma ceylanicum]